MPYAGEMTLTAHRRTRPGLTTSVSPVTQPGRETADATGREVSAGYRADDPAVDLRGESLDLLGKPVVPFEQLTEVPGLPVGNGLSPKRSAGERLSVGVVGFREGPFSIGLTGLSEQDQRCRVRRL